jgi:hypothetical protein
MESESESRIRTEARIQNHKDLWDVKRGLLPPDQAHWVTVTNALLDTGATPLSLPLEHLDFVVDLWSRSLFGNPANGGEHVYELH